MSIIDLFVEKYISLCHNYQLPSTVIMNIFDYHKIFHLSNSKMVIYKRGNFILNCSHYVNNVFYRCPDFYKDEHLHCGKCGAYLKNNIKLKKTLFDSLTNISVCNYKRPCSKLTDNHMFYDFQL
jgi:hypothetical protein